MSAEKLARRRQPGDEVDVSFEEMVAADQEALNRAYPVRKNPAKGYNYKIVCPMCEAPGYVPPPAAGQEVKCHNPHCMVPIFKAPEIKKKKIETEPVSKGLSPLVYGGIAVGVLAFAVGGYLLFLRGSNDGGTNQPIPFTSQNPGAENSGGREDGQNSPSETLNAQDQGPTYAEIRAESMWEMKRAAPRVPRNRKAIARRWCAEVAISMGKLKEARTQLKNLANVGETVPFLKIPPLVEMSWIERRAGHQQKAEQLMKDAQESALSLRSQGRFRFEAAMSLAGLLAAAQSIDAAAELISKHNETTSQSRLAADIFIAQHATKFDFIAAQNTAPIGGWQAPLVSGVTAGLVAREEPEAALQWAKHFTAPESQAEAAMVWAEFLILLGRTQSLEEKVAVIHKEIAPLAVPGRVMVLSRAATLAAEQGHDDIAEKLVDEASTLLQSVKISKPLKFADKKAVIQYRFPSPLTHRMTARAFGETARAQIASGQTKAGLETLDRGLKFCRAYAPAPGETRVWMDELDSKTFSVMRELLREELRLPSDDDARRQLSSYSRNCERLDVLADKRFALQTDMIAAALSAETVEAIAERIESSAGPDAAEPYMSTKLPWLVAEKYLSLDDEDEAEKILNLVKQSVRPVEEYRYEARRLIAQDRFRDASKLLSRMKSDDHERDFVVFSLVASLIRENQWKPALMFCRDLEDNSLGEEALWMGSAQASQRGETRAVFAYVEKTKPRHIEKISIYSGIVLGSSLFLRDHPQEGKNIEGAQAPSGTGNENP